MAAGNGAARPGEESPLLGNRRDDASEETLMNESGGGMGDDEEVLNGDKANQSVGRMRGVFIILSVFGLIFLQGMLSC